MCSPGFLALDAVGCASRQLSGKDRTRKARDPRNMTESAKADFMDEPQPTLPVRLLFDFYKRIISPVFHSLSPTQCKYLPTCSEYAYIALVRFGPVKGSWLALRRLGRCHPFAKGGLDPVPDLPAIPPEASRPDHLP
jgi:putative membrane protein insertion efficiency factor